MAQVKRHVFVSVGTDHHRFDRLITWTESWVPPDGIDVEVLVQHGFSRTPAHLPACAFLDSDALRSAITSADVVVTQGGPGGIMDARRAGIMPIVVPRSHALGEHVDDHQIAFARHIASLGEVVVVASESELHQALDAGVLDPDIYRTDAAPATAPETIAAFGHIVEQVVQRSPGGLRGRLPSLAALRRRSPSGTQLSHP